MMPIDSEDLRSDVTVPGADTADKIEAPEDLEKTLAGEKKRSAEYLASWQRAQADFINFKRRSEQERQDFNSYANANLLLGILPVLDDLELALKAVPPQYADDDWVKGVRLVERKFRTSLEGQGVKAIKALGEPFDPHFHEALRQEKGKESIVLQELQKGYMLHDKLLRPARVVVGVGEEEIKEE